jgi:hypothetical protein
VVLLSVIIRVCVGCTCESGCRRVWPADAAALAAWAWWRRTAEGVASDGSRWWVVQ